MIKKVTLLTTLGGNYTRHCYRSIGKRDCAKSTIGN